MTEVPVGKAASFEDGSRRIVFHGDVEIGVFHWDGQFYAYANLCLHQGGPACEGLIMHQVEDVIGADKTWVRPEILRERRQLRLPVARLRIRPQDRRMRRRPPAQAARLSGVDRGGDVFVVADLTPTLTAREVTMDLPLSNRPAHGASMSSTPARCWRTPPSRRAARLPEVPDRRRRLASLRARVVQRDPRIHAPTR